MNIPTAITSSAMLTSGLASPPVSAVEAARRTVFAACGTRAAGAPTAMPMARAVSGSCTSHMTEAARSVPAAGRSTVDSMSRVWSTAGTLSPTISMRVATPNRISARLVERKEKDGPRVMKPPRASAPASSSGSQARRPAQAASPTAMPSDETTSPQATVSITDRD
jgi:hypothetical protein